MKQHGSVVSSGLQIEFDRLNLVTSPESTIASAYEILCGVTVGWKLSKVTLGSSHPTQKG